MCNSYLYAEVMGEWMFYGGLPFPDTGCLASDVDFFEYEMINTRNSLTFYIII